MPSPLDFFFNFFFFSFFEKYLIWSAYVDMTQVGAIPTRLCNKFYTKVDEEKKVGAVREFYRNMSGNFTTVERLQLLSG